jgi:hypothetical protein
MPKEDKMINKTEFHPSEYAYGFSHEDINKHWNEIKDIQRLNGVDFYGALKILREKLKV